MSDIVQEAVRRREHLLAEVHRLDQFIETATMLKNDGSLIPELSHTSDRPLSSLRVLKASAVADVASDVLRATGRPLSRGELYRKLRDAGVRIPGDDPLKNLGTILWRSGRFDNSGRTYWFKDEERPEAS